MSPVFYEAEGVEIGAEQNPSSHHESVKFSKERNERPLCVSPSAMNVYDIRLEGIKNSEKFQESGRMKLVSERNRTNRNACFSSPSRQHASGLAD